VKCPICKKEVSERDRYYPFCSERCKLIDLGNWASGRYVISTPIRPDSERKPPEGERDEDGE